MFINGFGFGETFLGVYTPSNETLEHGWKKSFKWTNHKGDKLEIVKGGGKMFEESDNESSIDSREAENLGLAAITESLFSSSKDKDPKKDSSLDVLSFEFNNMSYIF